MLRTLRSDWDKVDTDPEILDPYVSCLKNGHIGDSKRSIPPTDYLTELKDWLKNCWGTGDLQVVGNGRGGWWSLSSSGTTTWTTTLPRDSRQLLKPYHPHGKVAHLALGVNGACVVLFEDGHVDWDLRGCYDGLDAELETRSQGDLIYASLSAYQTGLFFVAFKDATVRSELPEGAEDLDEDFVAAETLMVVVPSDTAKHTDIPVSERPSAVRTFSEEVLKGVTVKTIESAILRPDQSL
ncbi:hypothetical protein LTR37_014991 [Vermiconidia calcicola]|uniref:Uncharacterized protein n=1 Tax=Vermiconidia calcicola TaxID=1690605 RepID=A0ACC3MTJ5_9PEZI|nr:hypothetical protein LTR37_014991 [Vermiconidia calcicola]